MERRTRLSKKPSGTPQRLGAENKVDLLIKTLQDFLDKLEEYKFVAEPAISPHHYYLLLVTCYYLLLHIKGCSEIQEWYIILEK